MSKKHVVIAKAYDRRGRIICVTTNSYTKTHTAQARYAFKSGRPGAIYLHAELRAIVKAKSLGKEIYRLEVSRFNNDGSCALAKPCKSCMMAIKDCSTIKELVWTI